MRAVPRLLPSLIVAATIMLSMRVGMLWRDAGTAFAQAQPAAPGAAPVPAAAPTPPPAAPAEAAPAGATDAAPAKPQTHFSAGEVQVLQELSQRRTELDKRAEDQDRRELTLKAVEQRIDEKIAQLKTLQAQIDAMIGKSEAQDDDRIKGLVHIYENMKPKDAATIFDGMDMPALLQLLTRMKDLKTAPILAAMTPDKARAVTIAMAQRREMPEPKSN
jgi:flagellar motility protein MotE (MotC chaperone)